MPIPRLPHIDGFRIFGLLLQTLDERMPKSEIIDHLVESTVDTINAAGSARDGNKRSFPRSLDRSLLDDRVCVQRSIYMRKTLMGVVVSYRCRDPRHLQRKHDKLSRIIGIVRVGYIDEFIQAIGAVDESVDRKGFRKVLRAVSLRIPDSSWDQMVGYPLYSRFFRTAKKDRHSHLLPGSTVAYRESRPRRSDSVRWRGSGDRCGPAGTPHEPVKVTRQRPQFNTATCRRPFWNEPWHRLRPVDLLEKSATMAVAWQ